MSLDNVHLRPSDEAFAVGRDGAGLAVMVERLAETRPGLGHARSHLDDLEGLQY